MNRLLKKYVWGENVGEWHETSDLHTERDRFCFKAIFMQRPGCHLQSVSKSAFNFEVLPGSMKNQTAWI